MTKPDENAEEPLSVRALYLVSKSTAARHRDEPPASVRPLVEQAGIPRYADILVGRTSELQALEDLIGGNGARLVTIHGPGGMGKTRLTATWASRTARMGRLVTYVPLAPVTNGDDFPIAIASALGLTVNPGSDPADDVLQALSARRRILVLDNLEHLVHAPRVLPMLRTILERASGVQLVVTSRERLGLSAEHVLELRGLGVPKEGERDESAVELFEQRARQMSNAFDPPRHREAVIGICRLLEGMPLGIELAATWVRVLGCDEILVEIGKTLDFLTADSRSGRDERQSSMRAVFAQSWKLLTEDEQRVLSRLSIFRGGFDRLAAERVAGASLPLLTALVDRSLVHTSHGDQSTRFEMHELLRQFAAERLVELAERDPVGRTHAEYYVELALGIRPHLRGARQVEAVIALSTDLDNLRGALEYTLEHGEYASAARLGWALWPFWWIRNLQREGRRWLERLLPHIDALDLHWQIQATIALGAMTYASGDVEGGVRSARELQRLAAEAGNDPRPLSFAHCAIGFGHAAKGDMKGAVEHLTKARELFLVSGDPGIAAQGAAWLGTVQLLDGHVDLASESASAGLAEALAAGDRLAATTARYCLARVAVVIGHLDQARSHLLASVAPSLDIYDRGSLSYIFELLGVVCARGNAYECGARMFGASDAILEAIGNRGHTSYLADSGAAAAARRALIAALGEGFAAEYEAGKTDSIDALVIRAEQAVFTARSEAPPRPTNAAPGVTDGVQVQFFDKDDSVFLDHDYVVKGVPGRLLWRMLQLHESEGRADFTNRELRLDPSINLPGFRDNLETRLVLLIRRLDEKNLPIRLERTGRGRLRLVVTTKLVLSLVPAQD